MAGYIQDPLHIINLITDNLRDRYESGFPVLKEIIQNVDDAASGDERLSLEFGLSEGIPEAGHPLLKGEALYFLNNGDFRDSDSRAIRSFGLNSKAAEQSAIGKFGLGMKSVFHFCEAFFFLAESGDKVYEEVLNPWSGSDEFSTFHSDWDVFTTEDGEKIRQHLRGPLTRLTRKRKSSFILWLPLRKREHLLVDGKEVGSIISEFPGDDKKSLSFLWEEDLAQRVTALLPLLRRVTSIRFSDQADQQVFEISLDKRSKRIGQASEEDSDPQMLGAAVYEKALHSPAKFSFLYAGQQAWPDIPELEKLKCSPLWPKTFVRNEQGQSEEAPDRARGHGAAVFSHSSEKGNGRLEINWAVFLPVGEKNGMAVRCSGDTVFRLTLHGHFFIDAGRAFIEGLDDGEWAVDGQPENEADLRRKWNRILARQGTLSLIVPALEAFAAKTKLSAEKVWTISTALGLSQLFSHSRRDICRERSWVCRLTRNGREWKNVSSNRKILALPEPPQTVSSRPWDVFPVLDELTSEGVVLLLQSAPHLHLRVNVQRGSMPQWAIEDLLRVLALDEKKVFTDQGRLDYLLKFLQEDGVSVLLSHERLQKRLRDIASTAFTILRFGLQQNRSKVQEFMTTILPQNRFRLAEGGSSIVWELQECEVKPLIVSREFDAANQPGAAELSTDDSITLLAKLDSLIVGYEAVDELEKCDQARKAAGEILQGLTSENRKTVLGRSTNLKVLAGYDCNREKEVSLSVHDLLLCKKTGLLFRYSQGTNLAEWLALGPKLQSVLQNRVILINRDTADLVFGPEANTIQLCNANAVLFSLGSVFQALQAEADRLELIMEMAAADLALPERVRGLRFLLHGLEELFDYDETLWIEGYEQGPVWRKIWQQLAEDDGHYVLQRETVGNLPSNKWGQLGIKEIKSGDIVDELSRKGTGGIEGEAYSRAERESVLRELENEEELWKALPFHETVAGELVRIESRTYLESNISLTGELSRAARIIKRSDNNVVSRQQRQWLMRLSPGAVITLALEQESPSRFQDTILTHLDNDTISTFHRKLIETAWLKDVSGNSICPSDVIWLDPIQDDVERLLDTTDGVYCSPANLSDGVLNHSAFALLSRHCFAQGREGLEKVSLLVAETEAYHIGTIRVGDETLPTIAQVCSRLPVECGLPGWRLLASALSSYPLEDVRPLLEEMRQPVSVDKIVHALSWLQREDEGSGPGGRDEVRGAFNGYLSALAGLSGARTCLSKILLLNREGNWKKSNELCAEAEGVANSHLLDDRQHAILRQIIVLADRQHAAGKESGLPQRRNLEPEIQASSTNLEEFFREWEGLVPSEIICAFLALLGDDPGVLNLAEKYRGRHSVEWVRDNIPWRKPDRMAQDGQREWLYGFDQHQAFAQHRFIVKCSEGETVEVSSILGKPIEVPLKSRFTSLISGGLFYELSNDAERIPVRIVLRKPDLDEVAPSELVEYLRATAEYLLKKAYNQREFSLSALWDELGKAEQLDIRIAQQLVLSHVPFYLRQLGVHKHPVLKGLIERWNDARYKQEEYYESPEKKEAYEKRQREVLGKIQKLLKDDGEVQNAVLEAVRAKMSDYQYTVASIPFELFQNADDSVVELAEIQAFQSSQEENPHLLPEHVKRFVVVEGSEELSFLHWGRPVNAVGTAGFPGREKGYHHDLEKMLVLSSSDKQAEGGVTGKFGLGFKSVLLACDIPKLVSGQLAAEIVGGLCPVPLTESGDLRSRLREHSADRRWQGTLIELPVPKVNQDGILTSFRQLSGVMTIFSRQVRRIDMQGEENLTLGWSSEVTSLPQGGVLEFGALPWQGKVRNMGNALYFRLQEGGLLLAIGPDGFRALPDMPAIWVVAPTKEYDGLGFAVNCGFDLDAGRERLSGSSKFNREKASRLGVNLGKALVDIADRAKAGWPELKETLHLKKHLSLYEFWASLWEVLGSGVRVRGNDNVRMIMSELLSDAQGLGYLAQREAVLPNGLWGEYRALTRAEEIRTVLKGCLTKERYFKGLIEWGFFKSTIGEPASVMTHDQFGVVKSIITQLGEETRQWRTVELVNILQQFIAEKGQVSPVAARTLGSLFYFESLKDEDLEQERDGLTELFHEMAFKAADGVYRPASMLLVEKKHPQANPDESRRAAFAPASFVLAKDYNGQALEFFLICREKIEVEVGEMVEWLLAVEGLAQRTAGLQYIMEGEHGERVAALVRKKGTAGTWLADLTPGADYFREWDETDVEELLLRKLSSLEDLRRGNLENSWDTPIGNIAGLGSPEEFFNSVYEWWQVEQVEILKQYENKIYPRNIELNFAEDEAGKIHRESWLALFCLASFQTMGRQRGQQHRGFIERCVERGWWSTFARPQPEMRSDEWMHVLEEYIGEQVDRSEYEIWMNRFPVIYKFARWLNDYYEAFLSINRMTEIPSLSSVLKTRSSNIYQGGGISAPPIEKSLSLGANFVIRELKRKKILNGNLVDRYCILPNGRMQQVFSGLGCTGLEVGRHEENSAVMYTFLSQHLGQDRADFGGSYDIPLQMYVEDL